LKDIKGTSVDKRREKKRGFSDRKGDKHERGKGEMYGAGGGKKNSIQFRKGKKT